MSPDRTSRARRGHRASSVVAASLLLAGCLYSVIPEESPHSTESLAPDTTGVSRDLLPFYSQELEWEACQETFDCATVKAPLDWANPASGDTPHSSVSGASFLRWMFLLFGRQ